MKKKKSNFLLVPRTTFNLVNTIIGGGALALPFGFKNCGLLLGSVLVLSVGLISYYSAHLLIKLVKEKNSKKNK